MRLTLRTLLAYLDDTLSASEARQLGLKLAESPQALELVEKIRKVIRKRGMSTPTDDTGFSDPNAVAAYLSDKLTPEQVAEFEALALESDVHLAEVAACHQILTLLEAETVRVPPSAYRRMYGLTKGPESLPGRTPGKTIPIDGLTADSKALDADDDAPYLLGLSAYSKAEPSNRAVKWAAGVLLAVGVAVASFMAWPKGEVARTTPTGELAQGKTAEPVVPPLKPTGSAVTSGAPVLPDDAGKPVEPMAKPDEVPPMPAVPVKLPPREGRQPVARIDSADDRPTFAKKDDDAWKRLPKAAEVMTTDRLLVLPGFAAKVKYDGGLTAELWGNVPDLLPLPVLETSLTPHLAYDTFDADFTLAVGRVYLSTTNPKGAKVRVRFLSEVWDVSLPDTKCEAVVEVGHALTPGPLADAPTTTAYLAVRRGSATLNVGEKDLPELKAGEFVEWTSDTKKLAPAAKLDAKGRDAAYFNPAEIAPDATLAKAARTALSEFADRVKTASLQAALSELRTLPTGTVTESYFAGGRFSILACAAVGDLNALADAANDAERPDLRAMALLGLRHHLAVSPAAEEKFLPVAREKWRLKDADTADLLRWLRGPTKAEWTDAKVLQSLVDMLSANEIVQRQLAHSILSEVVDPPMKGKKPRPFDPALPPEQQAADIAAWKKRVEEIANGMK